MEDLSIMTERGSVALSLKPPKDIGNDLREHADSTVAWEVLYGRVLLEHTRLPVVLKIQN